MAAPTAGEGGSSSRRRTHERHACMCMHVRHVYVPCDLLGLSMRQVRKSGWGATGRGCRACECLYLRGGAWKDEVQKVRDAARFVQPEL